MGRSSAFEAGDKVRPTDGRATAARRTIDYVGPQMIVYTIHRPSGDKQCGACIDQFRADYELVPEVFEAGERYTRIDRGGQVYCLYADDTIALLKNEAGAKYVRGQDSRDEYEEA